VADSTPKAKVTHKGQDVGNALPIPFKAGTPVIEIPGGKCEDGRPGTNLSVNPATVDLPGTAKVTALITDDLCNPVSGVTVNFSVHSSATLSASSVPTNAAGLAQATVTGVVAETALIRATIAAGEIHGSPVQITFRDVTPPIPPVITSPGDEDILNSEDVVFEGTGEPGAQVNIRDEDGNDLCTTKVQDDGSWSCKVVLPEGNHTLEAVQTDPSGNESDPSISITITVDTTAPPAPEITSPKVGDRVDTSSVKVSGTGEPGATLRVRDGNATVLCVTKVHSDGLWTCQAGLPDGVHTLDAVQTDPAGNISEPSDQVRIVVDTRVVYVPTGGSVAPSPILVGYWVLMGGCALLSAGLLTLRKRVLA
jgi:hypothetical protein